ncbi:hypothetical protein M231_01832 [Tremella mesenterica]|uniref:CFEM domain-containing protein n=1 Tax=Tremella mesenterica TaxID=5217 RepID=A0A4Q1BSH9_TREME|nr:hypothetical protein M231_01832 [Tremella mesenterica]
MPYIFQRQDDPLSVCAQTCMATGELGTCTSVTDYACICTSDTYISSVATCWASNCTAAEATAAQAYSQTACSFYLGGNSTTAGNSTSTNNGTAASASASVSASPMSTEAPYVIPHSFVVLQGVMSSICAAILLLAILMGALSVRSKIQRENATQNRSWTGVGGSTFGTNADSKHKPSFGFRSGQTGSSAFTNSRNATSTFASDVGIQSSTFGGQSQGQTVSFGAVGPHGTGGRESTGKGFTNRLTLGDMGTQEEEWEMEVKEDKSVEVESPTRGESEIELEEGSTVHLNRLDRFGGHAL